jgi:hypothetical protein
VFSEAAHACQWCYLLVVLAQYMPALLQQLICVLVLCCDRCQSALDVDHQLPVAAAERGLYCTSAVISDSVCYIQSSH